MGFFVKAEKYGHDLVNEVEEHVQAFIHRLEELEQDIVHRKSVVNSEIGELQDERAALNDSLDRIHELNPKS